MKSRWTFLMALLAMAALAGGSAGAMIWDFNTDGDTEGWAASSPVTASVEATGGDLVVTADAYTEGGVPAIAVSGLSIDADTHRYLYIDVSRPTTSGAYTLGADGDYQPMLLYFDNGAGMSEADTKYLISHATNNGQYNAVFDLATATGGGGIWTGTVTALQLGLRTWDAANTMSGQTFRINKIAITETPEPYYWDWDENLPEGWLLTDAMTMNWTGGAMELSGTAGLVFFTHYSWWGTGRMFFDEGRDRYLRIDCAATNDGVSDNKWLGIHIKDNAMGADYATGWAVQPNAGMKSYVIDLATALSPNWVAGADIEGSLTLDTANWANFAAENTTLTVDYLAFSDGTGDADGDGVTDAQELSDGTDPGSAASYNEITVPDVAGMSETNAIATLNGAGLAVGTITEEASATVPAGSVISQDPASGGNHGGVPVDLVVSTGAPQVAVPGVVGMSEGNATTAIEAEGLVVGTVSYQYSDSVPTDEVISQNPAASTMVDSGSSVNLVVSQGPEPATVPVAGGLGVLMLSGTLALVGALRRNRK